MDGLLKWGETRVTKKTARAEHAVVEWSDPRGIGKGRKRVTRAPMRMAVRLM